MCALQFLLDSLWWIGDSVVSPDSASIDKVDFDVKREAVPRRGLAIRAEGFVTVLARCFSRGLRSAKVSFQKTDEFCFKLGPRPGPSFAARADHASAVRVANG